MNYKKVLIAVDASENSLRAVEYTGRVLGCSGGMCTTDLNIELLSVTRPPQKDLFADEQEWEKKSSELEARSQEFLEQARTILEDLKVPRKNISTRHLCTMEPSIAQNILKVQEEGGFGTIVVGRRGMSKAEEFLMGSVSTKVVHYAKNCTVWVVQ